MRPAILLFVMVVLSGCNNQAENINKDKVLNVEQQTKKPEKSKIKFNAPVQIDRSTFVMYPLTIENNEKESNLSTSRESAPATYWNIIFYNTLTGQFHLLDNKKKMIIYSYQPDLLSSSTNQPVYPIDNFIYYDVITNDYNSDGKINSDDPHYLFLSDKTGMNFKQISPENLNVINWQLIKKTNKILILTIKDTNNNKRFEGEDQIIPFVYDLKSQKPATEIFNKDFKLEINNLFDKQWSAK